MDKKQQPHDSDPSEMTDFEKNATTHELDDALPSSNGNRSGRQRQDHEPDDQTGAERKPLTPA
jgi:hypothetical protein